MEIVLLHHLRKGAHLFDPDCCFRAEFYPDRPDCGCGGDGIGGAGRSGVFFKHGACGACGESHFLAAATSRKAIVRDDDFARMKR